MHGRDAGARTCKVGLCPRLPSVDWYWKQRVASVGALG
jgi:hypothetical protein